MPRFLKNKIEYKTAPQQSITQQFDFEWWHSRVWFWLTHDQKLEPLFYKIINGTTGTLSRIRPFRRPNFVNKLSLSRSLAFICYIIPQQMKEFGVELWSSVDIYFSNFINNSRNENKGKNYREGGLDYYKIWWTFPLNFSKNF